MLKILIDGQELSKEEFIDKALEGYIVGCEGYGIIDKEEVSLEELTEILAYQRAKCIDYFNLHAIEVSGDNS